MERKFSLKKKERLKSRKLLDQLFKSRISIAEGPFRTFYLVEKGQEENQNPVLFGCGVSKKHFKRAVDRNRVKRLIREAYRLQQHLLQDTCFEKGSKLFLFVLFTGRDLPDFNMAHEKLGVILLNLQSKIQEQAD